MICCGDTPDLAVVINTFEQCVQRDNDRDVADTYYSGKKKQHTLKSQVAVDEETGQIVDVADSVRGPPADISVLEQSGLLSRLPSGVGGIGDLAYVCIAKLHPKGLGASPRRKPRGKDRPPEDIVSNRAFSRRRLWWNIVLGGGLSTCASSHAPSSTCTSTVRMPRSPAQAIPPIGTRPATT